MSNLSVPLACVSLCLREDTDTYIHNNLHLQQPARPMQSALGRGATLISLSNDVDMYMCRLFNEILNAHLRNNKLEKIIGP